MTKLILLIIFFITFYSQATPIKNKYKSKKITHEFYINVYKKKSLIIIRENPSQISIENSDGLTKTVKLKNKTIGHLSRKLATIKENKNILKKCPQKNIHYKVRQNKKVIKEVSSCRFLSRYPDKLSRIINSLGYVF